jgi:hypothetical protein
VSFIEGSKKPRELVVAVVITADGEEEAGMVDIWKRPALIPYELAEGNALWSRIPVY